jgi:hypothetical protein
VFPTNTPTAIAAIAREPTTVALSAARLQQRWFASIQSVHSRGIIHWRC